MGLRARLKGDRMSRNLRKVEENDDFEIFVTD